MTTPQNRLARRIQAFNRRHGTRYTRETWAETRNELVRAYDEAWDDVARDMALITAAFRTEAADLDAIGQPRCSGAATAYRDVADKLDELMPSSIKPDTTTTQGPFPLVGVSPPRAPGARAWRPCAARGGNPRLTHNPDQMTPTPTLTPPPGRPKFADPAWLANLNALSDLARLEEAIDKLREAGAECRAPAEITAAMLDNLVIEGTGWGGSNALAERLCDDGFHRRLVEDAWFAVDLDRPTPDHWRALFGALSEAGLLDDLRTALESYDLRDEPQPEFAIE